MMINQSLALGSSYPCSHFIRSCKLSLATHKENDNFERHNKVKQCHFIQLKTN